MYGAENMIVQLCRALKGLGCTPILGVFDNRHKPNTVVAEVAERRGLQVKLFECRGRLDRKLVRDLVNFIQAESIQLVHTHGYKANIYGYLAARRARVAAVATCHNWPGKTLRLRFYSLLDRLTLRRFDFVGAVSETVLRSLMEFGVPADKIAWIDNGVDVLEFSETKRVLPERPGRSKERLVGIVGRLAPEKGIVFLLQAARGIVAAIPQTCFIFAGDGPDRQRLIELARDMGIEKNTLFPGWLSDLSEFYASLEILVLPSLNEGMPLAVLEAMSAKKPVIASRVGAIPKAVIHGETGLLVEPGDVAGLEAAMLRLLQNPTLANEMGTKGFERVQDNFSYVQMGKKYLDVYQKFAPGEAETTATSTG